MDVEELSGPVDHLTVEQLANSGQILPAGPQLAAVLLPHDRPLQLEGTGAEPGGHRLAGGQGERARLHRRVIGVPERHERNAETDREPESGTGQITVDVVPFCQQPLPLPETCRGRPVHQPGERKCLFRSLRNKREHYRELHDYASSEGTAEILPDGGAGMHLKPRKYKSSKIRRYHRVNSGSPARPAPGNRHRGSGKGVPTRPTDLAAIVRRHVDAQSYLGVGR